MKKIRKALLTASLLCGAFAVLGACKDTTVSYSFNTNGGAQISTDEVEIGTEYKLPVPQEREGYEFQGWYTNADFSGEPVTVVTASQDQTYYAKWEQLYAVSLDLDGGSLDKTTFYMKEGENVYDFMQNYVPTKSGYVFGAWFNGENELSKNTRMTTEGISLKAKYKIGYTVEIWQKNLEGTEYVKVEEDIVGYEYVGKTITSEQSVTGFREVEHANAVTSLTISDTASANVFKHYFDRETYTLTFNPNYPDGSKGENKTETVQYGVEVEVVSDYALEGYCLVGWSTSASGEVVYKANYIDTVLFNQGDGEATQADKVMPERNTTLYGVWVKGYTDMFGGSDYIFVLDEESDVVYVSRGGRFFKGEYDPEDKDFLFVNNDEILTRGRLNTDGTFAYNEPTRDGLAYTLFESNVGLNATTKIYFDAYNGLQYSVEDSDGKTTESKGTYLVDENGYYVATFTEGPKAGETMTFVVGTVSGEPAFQARNEDEVNMGSLVRFVVYNGSLTSFKVYDITLGGFGVAAYNNGSSYTSYYYNYDAKTQTLTLQSSSGSIAGVAKVMEVNGQLGYMFYTETLDQAFTITSGGTLTMDGVCNATYQKDGVSIKGYYTTQTSVFGGSIVTMTADGKTYTFLIKETVTEIPVEGGEEGATQTVTTYTVEEKLPGYAEYYYKNENGIYYAPLIVVEDPAAGKATVYGYTETKEYVKVSVGTYVKDEKTGFFKYTQEEKFDVEYYKDTVDLSAITEFVFAVDEGTLTNYNINYWYSSTTGEGTTEYNVVYTTSESKATLTIVNGVAIYEENGNVYLGTYSTKNGITTVTTASEYLYFELTEEDFTFIKLDHSPYSARFLNADGSANSNEYITYDGKGGATYTIIMKSETEGEEDVTTKYVGTVVNTEKSTAFGAYIYKFSGEGKEFEFLELATSSAVYIAPYNATYNGDYESDTYGILSLDGFGYMASYTDVNGSVYEGMYFVTEENVITMMLEDNSYRYFDIKADKEFTVRGTEYGTYLLMDNQSLKGLYLEFNGYGKLTVYKMELNETTEEYERVNVDVNGTYTQRGDTFTLTYVDGSSTISLVGECGTFKYSSYVYHAFIVTHEEVVQTFVNEADWSVLVLDNAGNATKYSKTGVKEEGSYTLITGNLLYYVNAAATDACIYDYSVANGTATPITFTERGYYTHDLESLLFSQYGFAIFNGKDRLYYNVDNEGIVTIYKQDATNKNANEYGFVEEVFGKFENEKIYDGKTYYVNSGFQLQFDRVEETKDNYPVTISQEKYSLERLQFTPSGSAEFTVQGQVYVNGENVPCYITRSVDDENNVEMYVLVGYNNGSVAGSLRFDVTVMYNGKTGSNTYEVTGMKFILEAPSYTYLDTYYWYNLMDSFFGTNYTSTLTNDIGTITLVSEYDVDGNVTSSYVTGEFGEGSGMYIDEKLVSFTESEYTYKNGVYSVALKSEDGYDYCVYFVFTKHSSLGRYGYQYVLTREQTVPANDGYSVNVERVIASDSATVGGIYAIELLKDNEALAYDLIILKGDEIQYVVRTKDENGVITNTTYYTIKLVENADGSLDEESTVVTTYASATVTSETMTTLYTENGKNFVDISETDGVRVVSLNGTAYLITKEYSYDEETNTYVVVASTGRAFKIVVGEELVDISDTVVEETEDDSEQDA